MTEKIEKKEVKVSESNQTVKKLIELTKEEVKKLPLITIEYRRIYNKKTKNYTRYEVELFVNPRIKLVHTVDPNVFNKISLLFNVDEKVDVIRSTAACRFCEGIAVDKYGSEIDFKLIQCIVRLNPSPVYETFLLNKDDKETFEILLERKMITFDLVKMSKEESSQYSVFDKINEEE